MLVDETARILGIRDLLGRKPKALSGGQRQRVALGRAIVRKPSVFLFDEPLSNLDAELRVQMRAELARLQQRLQTTTVYVTHDQVEAMTLGQRIAVLAPIGEGRSTNLQQVGTPLEVYDRPRNVFVATFMGSPRMNLLTVDVGTDAAFLDGPGIRLALPASYSQVLRPYAGRRILMGIRPEHLREPHGPVAASRGVLRGAAEIVEPLGHEVIVHVRIGGELIIGKLGAHRIPCFGDVVELAIDSEALHLFDMSSKQRLGGS